MTRAATVKPPTQSDYLSVYKCTSTFYHFSVLCLASPPAPFNPVLQVGCRLPYSSEGTGYLDDGLRAQHVPYMQILHRPLLLSKDPGGAAACQQVIRSTEIRGVYIPRCIYLGSSIRS